MKVPKSGEISLYFNLGGNKNKRSLCTILDKQKSNIFKTNNTSYNYNDNKMYMATMNQKQTKYIFEI